MWSNMDSELKDIWRICDPNGNTALSGCYEAPSDFCLQSAGYLSSDKKISIAARSISMYIRPILSRDFCGTICGTIYRTTNRTTNCAKTSSKTRYDLRGFRHDFVVRFENTPPDRGQLPKKHTISGDGHIVDPVLGRMANLRLVHKRGNLSSWSYEY